MRSRSATFALALFGILLAVSLPLASVRSARRIWRAALYAGETPLQERSRIFDPAYVQTIEEMRRTIPRDGVYALVDADAVERGSAFWVRFDLAPRRAVYLGFLHEIRGARLFRERMIPEARWVIITSVDRPPVLYERPEFVTKLRAGDFR